MAGCSRSAALAASALLAFAALASAAKLPSRRRVLADGDAWWGNVTVVSSCPYTVAVKAGYVRDSGEARDQGHACPSATPVAGFPGMADCATEWVTIKPNESAVLADLPEGVWQVSAYVADSSPRHFLTDLAADLGAYLSAPDHFDKECEVPVAGPDCVWWATPVLNAASDKLVLSCPGYSPSAAPKAPEEMSDVAVVNNCTEAVEFKVIYQIGADAVGEDCVFDKYYGDERKCVTDWQLLEPGEERVIDQTVNAYWEFAARVAADPAYDLGERAFGAFQGTNETLACPESDVYGSGYVCEWWAPKCHFCDPSVTATEPLVIQCEGYTPKQG